jgi:uncharacterized membrane protein YoaK (UPF0700 family)
METKLIWLGMFVGSTIGGFVPMLWGDGALSLSSVFFSAVGGVLGIWLGYRLGH